MVHGCMRKCVEGTCRGVVRVEGARKGVVRTEGRSNKGIEGARVGVEGNGGAKPCA